MGKAGLILLLVSGMALTHPAGRRRAIDAGTPVVQGMRERMEPASASLKTLVTAMTDFRGSDRGGGKVNDFWTVDVVGLYAPAEEGRGAQARMLQLMTWFEPPPPRSGWDIID